MWSRVSQLDVLSGSRGASPPEARKRFFRGVRAAAVAQLDQMLAPVDWNLPALEHLLGHLDPTLSLSAVRARVVAVRSETHDVKTFVLRPNARLASFRPGSYVNVTVPIDGQRHTRAYSISSAPGSVHEGVTITVKRVAGGLISNWLHDHVQAGDVLTLSAPEGQFVLPETPPARVLMISAGSGITPVMSMLRHIVDSAALRPHVDVVFMHFARSPRDVIFADELDRIARDVPNVHVHISVERADDPSHPGECERITGRGRFTEEWLAEVAPDYRERDIFMCGPSPFMKCVVETLESNGADLAKLRYERFTVDFDAAELVQGAQVVRFLRSNAESISNRPQTILDQAEARGIAIESGCRAGNCGTCRCTKQRGVVVDVLTGVESGPGAESILACVSVPRGVVEVDL